MRPEDAADLIRVCHELARRGYARSSSGNVSLRCGERIYVTPTGAPLGRLKVADLALCNLEGRILGEARPTKEIAFHLAILRERPDVNAVVHTHPTHAVAASALLNPGQFVPAVTPQFVMRAGHVPVLPYHPPGSPRIAEDVAGSCSRSAVLLQNHGAVTLGAHLDEAVGILDELEENCRLWLLVRTEGRLLSQEEVADLLDWRQRQQQNE